MMRRSVVSLRSLLGFVHRAGLVASLLLAIEMAIVGGNAAQEMQAPPPPPPPEQTTTVGDGHGAAVGRETPPTPEALQATAAVISEWDGRDIGELFVAVKKLNKQKGAIDTIRELNKAIKEKKTPLSDAEATEIGRKLTAAQIEIKKQIIGVRVKAFAAFAERHPTLARTLSAIGDVGSWSTSDDINSDVDWTVFGTIPSVTRYFVEKFYNPMLLEALAGKVSGLDLRSDFDIVVTPEGWEKKAGVFETAGGKALAKTVMSRVIPVNADGTLGVPTTADVASELENTKVQARLHELATRMKVYDKVFDAEGRFKITGAHSPHQNLTEKQREKGLWVVADPADIAAVDAFLEAADEEGLLRYDTKIVRRSTLAGTCLDMAKHLHHEAIAKLSTLDKKGQIKRIMKYPGRSEWAYGKSSIPRQLIEDYVVMGDDKIRKLLADSAAFHKAKESKPVAPKKGSTTETATDDASDDALVREAGLRASDLAGDRGAADPYEAKVEKTKPVNEALENMISKLVGEYQDSEELGRLAETMIIRQAHLAMRIQLDEIVKNPDPAARGRQLQALIDDFGVVDEDGPFRTFARAQLKSLGEFKRISDDPTAFEKLKKSHKDLGTVAESAKSGVGERLRGFLTQSELGGRLVEIHDQAKSLSDRVMKESDRITLQIGEVAVVVETVGDHLRESSQLFRVVENVKQDLEQIGGAASAPFAEMQNALDRIGTAVDVLQAIGDAKTDADLAYNLGKALWDNSGVGSIVNTLYAFTVGGDNEAMGKFVMFALCPAASIPDLVGKIGNFSARTGAQKLFDMQLDALYAASRFAGDPPFADQAEWKDKNPWVLADFVEYGAGVPAVEAFLADLLGPKGYDHAERMIVDRVGRRLTEMEAGADVFMRAGAVKAIWVTLMLGDPVVLGEDGDLVAATQRVKLLTDDIVLLARQLGKEVARSPENFALPDGLSKGEQAALNKLVAERDVWVGKAKAAMAVAIVRTFEERRRADADLSDKEIERRMAELRALLTKLDVLEPGLYHLGEEGSFNFVQRHMPIFGRSTREQQRKLMAAINRYFDAYSQILSLRDAITQIIGLRTGALPARPPLTGAPPMCGERAIDLSAALGLFEKVRRSGDETIAHLTGLKGAPLGGPFDDRIRRGIDAATIDRARAEADGDIARVCRELHWKSEVIDRARFTEDAAASNERLAAATQRYRALIDEFIAYYAALKKLPARIVLTPAAPIQGQAVTATIETGGAPVPAEAIWVWSLDDAGRRVATWNGGTIRFDAPVRGRYRLDAALTLFGRAVKTVSLEFTVSAPMRSTLSVAPADPAPEATMTAQVRLEAATAPADAVWEWRCERCAVVAVRGDRAELKAPADGAGLVRVTLRGGPAERRTALVEATAPFRVDPTKKPKDGQKTDDTPPQPPIPPKTGSDTPVVVPVPDLSTWYMAMSGREELVALARRPNPTAADRETISASIARTEARMKAFWDAAVQELAAAEAYAGRMRAEVEKVYAGFAAKAGKPMADTGNVTDLEGETVASRNNACIARVEANHRRDLAVVDEDLTRIRGFAARFKAYSPERAVYREAMLGHDNLSVDHDKTRWKTKGYEHTFLDPCDGPPIRVTLPPANVAAAPPLPTGPTASEPPPVLELALDPAGKGRPEVTVIARVKGGRAPFAFAWSGAKSSRDDRAVYVRAVGKAPPVKAETRVSDAAGRTAVATLVLDPLAFMMRLSKTAPSASDLPVGAKASFHVDLASESGPIDANAFVLRWEPSTEAKFEREEGPGVTTNTAVWSRTGKTRVWAVALQRQGGSLVTVGESDAIELVVTESGIELDAVPADPFVGQEVRLTARETPPVADDAAAWWWESSGEALRAGQTAVPRVFTFVPKTTQPVTVTAHLKEKLHGGELAAASRTLTARPHAVTVVPLGPAFETSTTRPVVWRQGKGLVTLDRELLPDMDVGFRADVEPAPTALPLRYRWSTAEGTSLTGNPASRETRARRADAGSVSVSVEVRDANDVVLGTAGGSATVSVSATDLATGRRKVAELERAKQDATRAWNEGDLDAACRAAQAAAAIDPTYTGARSHCGTRDRVAGLVREAEAGIIDKTPAGLQKAKARLDEIRAINPHAKILPALEKKLAAAADADRNVERKRRMGLLVEGAAACNKADWKTCRAKLAAALEKAESVFEPADAETLRKARALRDRADREIAEAGKRDVERKRRMDEILAGAQLCGRSQWRACRDRLAAALEGGDEVFTAEDAGRIAKARELLARAEQMLATPSPPADGRAPTPPADHRTPMLPQPPPPDRTKPSRQPVPVEPATPQIPPSPTSGPTSGYDGVYVGTSTTDLGVKASANYTWTVRGDRIELRSDSGARMTGTIRPNGEFTIGNGATSTRGRIDGDVLSGTYDKTEDQDDKETGTFVAHRTAPGSTTSVAPQPSVASAPPQSAGTDGLYHGRAVRDGRETGSIDFEVAGARIMLVSLQDPQKRRYQGTLKPSGEFVIEFHNNTWTGRVAGGSIEGTWRMHQGILGGPGMSGTFHAQR